MKTLHQLREEYSSHTLDIADVSSNGIEQFNTWFQEALSAKLPEPNAMTLATCTSYGVPSARVVLLKEFDEKGFVFFTNYESRKGFEMTANPQAALVFLWLELQRQVRIEGRIEKISREESEEYFQSRPRGSQIGAWASAQSSGIPDRAFLENSFAACEENFKDTENIPTPPNWGGYRVIPKNIEFWQGRMSRLHDRLLYSLNESGDWKIERLAP